MRLRPELFLSILALSATATCAVGSLDPQRTSQGQSELAIDEPGGPILIEEPVEGPVEDPAEPAATKCYYIRSGRCKVGEPGESGLLSCGDEDEVWVEHASHDGKCGVEHQSQRCPLFVRDAAACKVAARAVQCGREDNILLPRPRLGWCECECVDGSGAARTSPEDLPWGISSKDGCAFTGACRYFPAGWDPAQHTPRENSDILRQNQGTAKCSFHWAVPEDYFNH